MHDYQLERLNTRSFEQLIQAIGIEVLGPQMMVFGDGPDGGREATFQGEIKYPLASRPWKGHGIVQAKFRQIPDSEAKKNADWAIKQLKAEFSKFKPRPKARSGGPSNDRVCPEYYVFCTNLILSPVAKSGGKDRVRTLLDGFKMSHNLKDYAIWDGDQIRRFLDGLPGIRTTYLAWLLPGDVLAEMIKLLELDKTNFLSTIRRYLESELLDDQFARLGQGGYTDAKNIPLSAVFVDLPIEISSGRVALRTTTTHKLGPQEADLSEVDQRDGGQDSPSMFVNHLLEEGRQVLKPTVLERSSPRQGMTRAQTGRIVLIGGPGQGKTTVGQFACQLLRAALLKALGGPFSPEVTQALVGIDQMAQGLPVVSARRYPLRVDLKHLASCLASSGVDHVEGLFDYLTKRISNRTNSALRSADFRKWLGAYPWVLVLDGLDEVPSSSNRGQVMQAIRDFVSVEAHSADADLLVLATTRPQGYSEEFDPSLYKHLTLSPLDSEQALSYGLRLATARHPGQRTRVEELTASLKRATKNSATVRLMQSPLQVTIMLALIEGGGEPPEQRWKLFHDYYDVIYRREKERGTPFSATLGRYEPDIHWIHRRIGWMLQLRNAAAGRTDARLTHGEFETIVDRRLQSSGHDDAGKRCELVESIRLAATDRLVLLVGNTEKEIGFEIRSLQEFMAAEHFFDGGEACVQKTLHAIGSDPYWRNVFLFAAGRIFFERQELIDSVIAVCSEMNDTPDDAAQRAVLSGSRLALGLLRDGAARNQPASIRVLARCASRGLDACDADVERALFECCSGEAEEVWREEVEKRLLAGGPTLRSRNWKLCLALASSGKSWAHDLLITRFPWKTLSLLTIFELGDVPVQVSREFWDKFAENVFYHPLRYLFVVRRKPELQKALSGSVIEQFFPIIGAEKELTLKLGKNASGLGFRIHGRSQLNVWAELKFTTLNPGECHPEWLICEAISNFARKPALPALVELVKSIAGISPDGKSCESWWYYPWQVAACVKARISGRSWEEIIVDVESGKLGKESDWANWEEECEKGVELARLGGPGGLAVSDQSLRLLVDLSGWTFSSRAEKMIRVLNNLSTALTQQPEIKSCEPLFDICFFGVWSGEVGSSVEGQKAIARFISVCSEHKVKITTPLVATVLVGGFDIAAKRGLLSALGKCPVGRGWLDNWKSRSQSVDKTLGSNLEGLLETDERWDILKVLSFLPPLDALQAIPEYVLDELTKKSEQHAKAASALKISSLRWKPDNAPQIVQEEITLKDTNPYHLVQLLDFIETDIKSGRHLETFLLECIKLDPTEFRYWLIERSIELLAKLVERRPATSELPDPAVRIAATRN